MRDPFFWGIAVVLYVSNKLSELKRQVQHVKGRGLSVLFFCFFHLRPPLPHQILGFDVILTASVGIQLSAFAMSTPYNTAVALGKIELESLKHCQAGLTYSTTDYILLPGPLDTPWVIAELGLPILRQIMFFCPIRHSMGTLEMDFERIFDVFFFFFQIRSR